MAKVTQLIPAPSLFEQTRQMLLAIISLAEKLEAAPEEYQDLLLFISMRTTRLLMLAYFVPTKATGIEPAQIAEFAHSGDLKGSCADRRSRT